MLLVQRRAGGQAIVFILIVLALLGGGYWWLVHSTKAREKDAADFVREAATQLAFHFDKRFLDIYLAPDVQTRFPPSFRERMIGHLRELGVPSREPEVSGTVEFTNRFFHPRGQFRAHLQYPNRGADLDLAISCPKGWWQIDYLNLTWDLPPAPPPPPAEAASPAASPAPTP